ncbi:MAG: hypothetical protein WC460_02735 [Patescibacteria group bacterium]
MFLAEMTSVFNLPKKKRSGKKFVDKFGKLKSRDGLLIKYKHLLNLPIPARVTGFCPEDVLAYRYVRGFFVSVHAVFQGAVRGKQIAFVERYNHKGLLF